MKWNLVRSIYGRSSIKIAHFVPIRWQTWPPQAILVSDWLISLNSSPLKPHGQMKPNLVGSIYGRTSIKIAHFGPICYQTWRPLAILVSDWSISKKLYSLKPPGQINRNMVGSIYGRSCINYAHFVPIHYKHGRHRQFFFLIGRFLKIFSSKTELPNEPKLGRKRSIYGRSSI